MRFRRPFHRPTLHYDAVSGVSIVPIVPVVLFTTGMVLAAAVIRENETKRSSEWRLVVFKPRSRVLVSHDYFNNRSSSSIHG